MSDTAARRLAFPVTPWLDIPAELLVRDKRDDVGKFFLAMAMAFNDYKGVVLMERALKEIGRPPSGTVTPEAFEWHGIAVQTHRLLAMITSGILELLGKSGPVLRSPEVRSVLSTMPPNLKAKWDWLVEAAREGKSPEARELLRVVRSELTAHYCATNTLWKGLKKRFRDDAKDSFNTAPRASLGSSVGEIRFYYADDAAQAAMEKSHGESGTRADDRIVTLAQDALLSVAAIVTAFIVARKREAEAIDRRPRGQRA